MAPVTSGPRLAVGVRAPPRRCFIPVSATGRETVKASEPSKYVSCLKQAALSRQVPPQRVFEALVGLERSSKQQGNINTPDVVGSWNQVIGGVTPPGRRWQLVFTSGTKQVQRALKNNNGSGSGQYFPLTAVQRWDAASGEIENGVYLGHIASLTFSGPYALKSKRLSFDFDTLHLKIGPLKLDIPLKDKIDPAKYVASSKDPFFIFFYADEEIIAARGRSGGVAFWKRTLPEWELSNGIV